MLELEATGRKWLSNILSELEDSTDEVLAFDEKSIDDFIAKVIECKTVRKVIDATDIDELNHALVLIDLYHNSEILKKRLDKIIRSTASNFSMDYFKEMLLTLTGEEDDERGNIDNSEVLESN